jgi:beta-lactamase class A
MFRLALAILCGFMSLASAQQADPGSRLQADIERLAQSAGGVAGVAVHHVETGRQLQFNAGARFPMASTFKIPVAVQLLTLVDQGSLSLDKVISLSANDLRPGSGTLVKTWEQAHPDYSVRSLLELMMIVSDNSATDVLWKEAGGSPAVMARLRALGVNGFSVDRPTALLLAAAFGIDPPPESDSTPARFREMMWGMSQGRREAAAAALAKDPRDTASPQALVDILLKIWRHEALSPAQSTLLLDIMARCETGRGRLKGLLPRGTRVAHKTGTLNGIVTNDAGIIALPGDAGHVAIAVMVKESLNTQPVQDYAIAGIARAVYDHFSLNPNGK